MTIAVGLVMILATASVIVLPLLRPPVSPTASPAGTDEGLEHEKHVALLAIREADFDRAMGKLSDEDHASLRDIYQQRALSALSKLDMQAESAPVASGDGSVKDAPRAAYCAQCGQPFSPSDRFCCGCGARRA